MNPALTFLLRRSFVNGLSSKLSRLKSVRYLVPFVLGLGYFAFVFGGVGTGAASQARLDVPASLMEWAGAVLLLIPLLLAWLVPSSQPGLAFSETEVNVLFSAPLRRRELIHFRLLSTQFGHLLGAALTATWASTRLGSGRFFVVFGGVFVVTNVLALHAAAVRFTHGHLERRGVAGVWRSLGAAGIFASYVGIARIGTPAFPASGQGWLQERIPAWLSALEMSHAGWMSYPLRALVRLPLSDDGLAFARNLPPALAIAGLLYAWVLRASVGFRELAVAQAATVSRRREAFQRGRWVRSPEQSSHVRPAPWKLSASGPPEGAFLWRGATSVVRTLSLRLVAFLVLVAAPGIFVAAAGDDSRFVVASLLATFAFTPILMGTSMLRSGLHQDLERIEVLKVLPLSGPRLVRCSILGGVFPIAVPQVALLIAAAVVMPETSEIDHFTAWRLAVAVGGCLVLPALTALSATIDAALVLTFPAWIQPGRAAGPGFERMGQTMLNVLVKMLGLPLALLPALLLAGVLASPVVAFASPGLLPLAVVLGSLGVAAAALGEVALASLPLGRRFAALDPAEEGLLRA